MAIQYELIPEEYEKGHLPLFSAFFVSLASMKLHPVVRSDCYVGILVAAIVCKKSLNIMKQ